MNYLEVFLWCFIGLCIWEVMKALYRRKKRKGHVVSNRIYLEWEQRSAPDGPWITMVTMTFPETEENMDMLIEASNIDEDEDEDGLTLFIERRNFHIVKIISEEQVIWRKEL